MLTALALGIPALLGENLTWRDIRTSSAEAESDIASEVKSAGERAQRLAQRAGGLQHGGGLIAAVGHAVFAAGVPATTVLLHSVVSISSL